MQAIVETCSILSNIKKKTSLFFLSMKILTCIFIIFDLSMYFNNIIKILHKNINIKEVLQNPHWKDAIMAKLKFHQTNGTWELVELPSNKQVLSCR